MRRGLVRRASPGGALLIVALVAGCSGGATNASPKAPSPSPTSASPLPSVTAGPVVTTTPSVSSRPRFTFASVPPRTAPPKTAACTDGTRAPILLAVVADGPPDDTRTRFRLQQLALCAGGVLASDAGAETTWVRTAGGGTFATVEGAGDLSDLATLYHRGKRTPLAPRGAGSTTRPEAYADGSVLYKASYGQLFRLMLQRPGRAPVSLGETTTTMTAATYSPSGKRLFVLAFDGLEPNTVNATLYVRDARGERTIKTGRPRGANLLALDDTRVVVGDFSETAADSSAVLDTATGVQTPLRPGLFATAYDAAGGRLLVHSAVDGRLSWLSGAAFAVETPLTLPAGVRVVGGDWLR